MDSGFGINRYRLDLAGSGCCWYCKEVKRTAEMNTYPDPIAVLIAVDGTPEGDYLVPFTGAPQRGGATLLDQWQVDDLLERGYQFA